LISIQPLRLTKQFRLLFV